MLKNRNKNSKFSENFEGRDGICLAAVSGADIRSHLPRQLFERNPVGFVCKFCFAMTVISIVSLSVIYYPVWYVIGLAVVVNGMMFAHLVELQHECLHGHSFHSPALNRFFGILCGVFMMVSTSHYRYDHLRHHAYLGTDQNLEHFNYRFQNLETTSGFAKSFFDLSRYKTVFSIVWLSLTNRKIPGIEKLHYQIKVKQESCFFSCYFSEV